MSNLKPNGVKALTPLLNNIMSHVIDFVSNNVLYCVIFSYPLIVLHIINVACAIHIVSQSDKMKEVLICQKPL